MRVRTRGSLRERNNVTNKNRFGALAVGVAVLGLVAYKEAWRTRVSSDAPATARGDMGPSIILVADPREADCACPAGQIIRMVRKARDQGARMREFSPEDGEVRGYGVKELPTVLFLDESGKVTARYEGEIESTVSSVREELGRMQSSVK